MRMLNMNRELSNRPYDDGNTDSHRLWESLSPYSSVLGVECICFQLLNAIYL